MTDRSVIEIDVPRLGALPPDRAEWREVGAAGAIELPPATFIAGPVDDAMRQLFAARRSDLPAYGYATLTDAFAYGDGLAIVDDHLLLDPSVTAGPADIGAWGFFREIGPLAHGRRNISNWSELTPGLKTAVLLTRRSDFVYGHWLLETLPRMALVPEIDADNLVYVVSEGIAEYQIEQLASLGIKRESLYRLAPGNAVHCERLYVPSLAHWAQNVLQPFAFGLYRKLVEQFASNSGLTIDRILVTRTSRRNDPRPLLNVKAVEALARQRGFAVVDPGQLPWRQQIAIFSNARYIIGLSGSNLHNTVYTGADAHVLTLQPNQSPNYLQTAIAGVRGHKISYLFGQSFADDDHVPPDCPYSIDIDLLDHAISTCFHL